MSVERDRVASPLLSSLAAFIGAAFRPRTMLARAIVIMLAIKLVAVAGMAVVAHFTDQSASLDAAAVDRCSAPRRRRERKEEIMEHIDPVSLARLQFAMTALYHFLFVPLTLGLSFLLAIMESVYVMTGREIWRDMTRFWGKLFGINFAMGVATGITMEFQFGTNWAYYSHYVGDIFGAPLAIEGLMAFFLESTFVGLFFFGWDRMSKLGHLTVTWLVAIGSNLSALWILIANGWMQNPVGAAFNPDTMRMELTSFWDLLFNPTAQSKFVHTVSAGYVTGAMFMLAISAYYLLNGRHYAFAKRSIIVASAFGLASALSVVVLGDESGYTDHRKPEDEARRDRGDVEDRAGAGAVHAVRAARSGDAAEPHTRSRFHGRSASSRRARSTRRCRASTIW